jgi:hypothetical protein
LRKRRNVRERTHNSWNTTHDRRPALGYVSLATPHARVRQGLDPSVSNRHADKHPRELDRQLEDVCQREVSEVSIGLLEDLVEEVMDGSDGGDHVGMGEGDALGVTGRALNGKVEGVRIRRVGCKEE